MDSPIDLIGGLVQERRIRRLVLDYEFLAHLPHLLYSLGRGHLLDTEVPADLTTVRVVPQQDAVTLYLVSSEFSPALHGVPIPVMDMAFSFPVAEVDDGISLVPERLPPSRGGEALPRRGESAQGLRVGPE